MEHGRRQASVSAGVGYPVELTHSRKWLTQAVYETKGVSPYSGWLVALHWARVL